MKRRGRIKLLLWILLAALVGEFFNLRFISRQKRELSLKADLRLMRQAIDNYTIHEHRPATTLQDLTSRHYLKKIPTDPFTHKEYWSHSFAMSPLPPNKRPTESTMFIQPRARLPATVLRTIRGDAH